MGLLLFIPLLFIWLFISYACAATAGRAYDFHHSVGVNVHLHYDGTCYDQWNVLFPLIVSSKIKHYRDGLIDTTWNTYYQRNNDLGNAGIKGVFITDFGQTSTLIATYPNRVTSFEGYEGPNEVDTRGDSDWVAKTKTITQTIWNAHNRSHFVVAYTTVGRDARAAVGDISAYVDYGSMHNYVGNFNPETNGWGGIDQYGVYGSFDWNFNIAKVSSGSKPIMTTETGFSAVEPQTNHNDVTKRVQAKYMLRVLLYQFLRGVKRTIIYQMCEWGSDGYWGLIGVQDQSNPSNMYAKPSYYAVRDLLTLIEDTSANAATFTPMSLSISLSGSTNNVRQVVMQKSNGVYYVGLWLDLPSWDVNARGTGPNDIGLEINVPSQQVTVTIPAGLSPSYYTFSADTGKINSPASLSGTSFTVTVYDMPSVLQLSPSPTPAPSSVPTQTPTATPTVRPTVPPTPKPATSAPTPPPTAKPTVPPTSKPTAKPATSAPTPSPTVKPTVPPTPKPATLAPTPKPATSAPTPSPTAKPTVPPTPKPATLAPTPKPTTSAPTPPPTAKPTASPSGTVVLANSGRSIVDVSGNVWTLTPQAQIAINSIIDPPTQKVILMAYVDGALWQQNVANTWYTKAGPSAAWSAGTSFNPLLLRNSDPTVHAIYGGSITDANGDIWNVTSGGQITVNGVVDQVAQQVLMLAYVQGTMWRQSATPLPWYGKTRASAAWSAGVVVNAQGYVGCYGDNGGGVRDLPNRMNGVFTVDACIATCWSQNYRFAGAQYGGECWCGSSYGSQGKSPESDCNMPCQTNTNQICGGSSRNSVYAATSGL